MHHTNLKRGPIHSLRLFQMLGPLRFKTKRGIINKNYFQEDLEFKKKLISSKPLLYESYESYDMC